jgi:hypothetical protein
VIVLGLLERDGVDMPTWIKVIGISWFVIGSLILGWYGWLKRVLVGILIFIPLMGTFLWWIGAVPGGWPTAVNILAITASIAVLVVIGVATGWFAELLGGLKQTSAKDPRARGK